MLIREILTAYETETGKIRDIVDEIYAITEEELERIKNNPPVHCSDIVAEFYPVDDLPTGEVEFESDIYIGDVAELGDYWTLREMDGAGKHINVAFKLSDVYGEE